MPNKDSNRVEHLRQSYDSNPLTKENINKDPLQQFDLWMQEAIESGILEPNAMTLCTVDPAGFPQGRIVLLKGYGKEGFRFFTNYNSHKGNDLSHNPRATLVFFWDKLQRQVRISGEVEKISQQDSSEYFKKRPIASQLGAIASPQSQEIKNRLVLQENLDAAKATYVDEEKPERPIHWGGYTIKPLRVEFWQGQKSRLHDRIIFEKKSGDWSKKRLAP